MKIKNIPYRTIWVKKGNAGGETGGGIIQIIDQRFLPHQFVIEDLKSAAEVARAIKEMHLRGAPLIGVAAAYGMYLAALEAPKDGSFDGYVQRCAQTLTATRSEEHKS